MAKIGIIGSGEFGVAIARICDYSPNNDVCLYSRDKKKIDLINKSREFLDWKNAFLRATATTDLSRVVKDSDYLFIAVPSFALIDVVNKIALISSGKSLNIVLCTKGVCDDSENLFYSEKIRQIIPKSNIAVLSGPSFAKEVIDGVFTFISVASKSMPYAEECAYILKSKKVRIHTTTDIYGSQLMGAFKNIMAFYIGLEEGFLGELANKLQKKNITNVIGSTKNKIAALFCVLIQEAMVLLNSVGSSKETIASPAGIGDIFLTCTSLKSRNCSTGFKVGVRMADRCVKGVSEDEMIKIYKDAIGSIDYINGIDMHKDSLEDSNTQGFLTEAVYAVQRIASYAEKKELHLKHLFIIAKIMKNNAIK